MGCGLREEAPASSAEDDLAAPSSTPSNDDQEHHHDESRSSSPEAVHHELPALYTPFPLDPSSDTAPLRGFLSASTRKLSTYKCVRGLRDRADAAGPPCAVRGKRTAAAATPPSAWSVRSLAAPR